MSRRRRLTVIAALYLVADIGYAFFLSALVTILTELGAGLEQLALIHLLWLGYTARFVVGPIVDRFGFARVGHYRGWLLITQLAHVLVWLAMVPLDPVGSLPAVISLMTVALTVSAFHDTAMGGLAVRLLPPGERGFGNGIQAGMASLSMVIGSGGALLLYSHAGWSATVGVLAVLYLVPFGVLLFVAEPDVARATRRRLPYAELVTLFRHPRLRAWTLGVLPAFGLGGYLISTAQSPIMVAAHWSLDRIALVQGVVSGVVGLVAGLAAGALVGRLGRRRSALVAGAFWTFALVLLLPLSMGGSVLALDVAAVLAGVAGSAGMTVCAYTVSMDLARPASAATDFTLQVSVLGALRILLGSAGLAVAAATSFVVLVCVAIVLTAAGTWVAVRWLGRHQTDAATSALPLETSVNPSSSPK